MIEYVTKYFMIASYCYFFWALHNMLHIRSKAKTEVSLSNHIFITLICVHSDSLEILCATMKHQIISRAFYGWLAHCRHLRTVRTHLAGLVLPSSATPPHVSGGLAVVCVEHWITSVFYWHLKWCLHYRMGGRCDRGGVGSPALRWLSHQPGGTAGTGVPGRGGSSHQKAGLHAAEVKGRGAVCHSVGQSGFFHELLCGNLCLFFLNSLQHLKSLS